MSIDENDRKRRRDTLRLIREFEKAVREHEYAKSSGSWVLLTESQAKYERVKKRLYDKITELVDW
jgi:hypothetical protein